MLGLLLVTYAEADTDLFFIFFIVKRSHDLFPFVSVFPLRILFMPFLLCHLAGCSCGSRRVHLHSKALSLVPLDSLLVVRGIGHARGGQHQVVRVLITTILRGHLSCLTTTGSEGRQVPPFLIEIIICIQSIIEMRILSVWGRGELCLRP